MRPPSIPIALLSLGLLAACSSLPKDGDACEADYCSGHGTCAFKDTRPACTCETGYIGVICSVCDDGYVLGADDTCQPVKTCVEGQCGAHGTCRETAGTTVCDCNAGWDGATCDHCYAGFHDDAGACVLDLVCLASTCSYAGTCTSTGTAVSCACADGHTGTWCETFTGSCETSNPCSEHGTCVDYDDRVRCVCQPGYGGADCTTCYPGFHPTEDGCALDEACGPTTCSGVGTCTVTNGDATCDCGSAYFGDACETCAESHHRAPDGSCTLDRTCAASNPCVGPGTCFESGRDVSCFCDPGNAGPTCEECYPGYHRNDAGTCVLDETCFPLTCRGHGTCTADAGRVSCDCDTGFAGDRCEVNIDDCANAACGTGRCIDLVDGLVCLCPNGSYGVSCPEGN